MKVYYIVTNNEWIGSFNKHKIEKMYTYKYIHTCDISDFTGRLLSSEYID